MVVVNTLGEPYLNQLSLMLGIYPSNLKFFCLRCFICLQKLIPGFFFLMFNLNIKKDVKAQFMLPLQVVLRYSTHIPVIELMFLFE